jgi:hypothetical protein
MSTAPNKNKGSNKGHDNLRPAKKGEVRNPHGRPKKEICIPDILRRIGEEPVSPVMLARLRAKWGPDFHPKNNRDAYLMVAMAQAQEGDADARRFISERCEGKVTDKLQVEDTTPTKIVFEEVLVAGQVVANTIKRTITRPNANPS